MRFKVRCLCFKKFDNFILHILLVKNLKQNMEEFVWQGIDAWEVINYTMQRLPISKPMTGIHFMHVTKLKRIHPPQEYHHMHMHSSVNPSPPQSAVLMSWGLGISWSLHTHPSTIAHFAFTFVHQFFKSYNTFFNLWGEIL